MDSTFKAIFGVILYIAILLAVGAFGIGGAGASDAIDLPTLAIAHGTVLPMTANGAALRDMTVILHDGRIASITPSANGHAPDGAREVDGRGKWLMPSLTDAHVHL